MSIKSVDDFGSGKRISLEMGTEVRVEIEGVEFHLDSIFIGMEADKYLIIKTPNPFTTIQHKLFRGNQLVIKYLYKGTVYMFQTRLIETVTKPIKLLFLEYPKIIQHHDLRSYKRMSCFIPSKLIVSNDGIQGAILDISRKGCRWEILALQRERTLALNINEEVTLMCQFPGVEGDIKILGKLKNIQKSKKKLILGVVFFKSSQEIQNIIANYIFSTEDFFQMAEK